MNERITYIFDRQKLQSEPGAHIISGNPAIIKDLDAAREWAIRFPPSGVRALWGRFPPLSGLSWDTTFAGIDRIDARWVNPVRSPKQSVINKPGGVYALELPPGLHVRVKLKDGVASVDARGENICAAIRMLFGADIECVSLDKSFSVQENGDAREYQFYAVAPTVTPLIDFLKSVSPDPSDQIGLIPSARRIDIAYDASAGLSLAGLWDESSGPWNDSIERGHHSVEAITHRKTEVAILEFSQYLSLEKLSGSGHLHTWAEGSSGTPTFFTFPHRHHSLPKSAEATFNASFDQPTGLHPTLRLSMGPRISMLPPRAYCTLYAYLTIPSHLFVDRYQLDPANPLFLASHRLRRLVSLTGEEDLEAADWAVSTWGSAALFELVPPVDHHLNGDRRYRTWDVTIPLHLRYLSPPAANLSSLPTADSASWPRSWKSVVTDNLLQAPMPWPIVYWSCPADLLQPPKEKPNFESSPFSQNFLGFDSHPYAPEKLAQGGYSGESMFMHIPPAVTAGQARYLAVNVPVIDASWTQSVQLGTFAAVLFGVFLIFYSLGRVAVRRSQSKEKTS